MAPTFDKAASGAGTITIPAGGIAQGNLVVVLAGSGLTSTDTLTSVTDSRGNTYDISTTYRTITGASGGRFKYAWCNLTTALQAGDVITCTWASGTVPVSGMVSYTGIDGAVLDQSAYGEQTSFPETVAPSTGASGTTTAADEVVVALFGCVEAGGADVTWTNTSGYTSRVDENAAANLACLYIEDRIATATGTFTSSPTPNTDIYYTGQLLTFKASGPPPAGNILAWVSA